VPTVEEDKQAVEEKDENQGVLDREEDVHVAIHIVADEKE